ncbi:hypothetical protein [Arsenophonus sp. PmNCSU2021_1]|uniref:hypothetical protein n=1 Tax=Arsenophonus sp. PmNCSU2021_1 TaxID=3118989 RepID=UPI002FEE8130
MEKKKIIKQLKELEIEFRKNNPDVIGYTLFNTVNRRFVTMKENGFGMPIYTDNLEIAYFEDTKFPALISRELLPEPDKFDIAVVPLIKNPLFGLSVKSGYLDRHNRRFAQ